MIDRSTAPPPLRTVGISRTAAIALPIILFAVMLLFVILVSLRYAYGV